jgi:hypothetical protein
MVDDMVTYKCFLRGHCFFQCRSWIYRHGCGSYLSQCYSHHRNHFPTWKNAELEHSFFGGVCTSWRWVWTCVRRVTYTVTPVEVVVHLLVSFIAMLFGHDLTHGSALLGMLVFTMCFLVVPIDEPVDKDGKMDWIGGSIGVSSLILFNFVWK